MESSCCERLSRFCSVNLPRISFRKTGDLKDLFTNKQVPEDQWFKKVSKGSLKVKFINARYKWSQMF